MVCHTRRIVLCASFATFAFASTANAQQNATTQKRFEQLIDQSAQETSTPVALAKLNHARSMALYVAAPNRAAILKRAMAKTKNPLVKAAMARHRVHDLQDAGDMTQGPRGQKGELATLGCLTKFSILGPFENASMEQFHNVLAPEGGEAGPYKGKFTQIDWRPLPDYSTQCSLNINRTVYPSSDAVVYLANVLKSPKKQTAKLLLGANGSYQVWLNGKVVGQRKVNTGMSLDNDAWTLNLNRGDNHLFIKMGSDQTSGMNLVARVVDKKLQPINNLTVTPKWSGKPVEAFIKENTPKLDDAGVLAQVQSLAKTATGSQALWNAWMWRLADRRNTATPWRDVAVKVYANLEAAKVTIPVDEYSVLSMLFEEHWKRIEIMSGVQKKHPTHVWTLTRLARLYQNSLSDTQRLEIRPLLESAIKIDPNFLPAVLSLSDWYETRSFNLKALAILNKHKNAQSLTSPRYQMELINALQTHGNRKQADALRASLYKTARINTGYAWHYLRQHLLRGDQDKALAIIRQMRQIYPASNAWLMEEVKVLRAQNKLPQAITLMDALIKDQPGNVSLLKRKANQLLALDKREEAAKVLDIALKYRPQDAEIRERVAHLRPTSNRFHEKWMVENVRDIAKSVAPGAFHTTTIVEQSITQVSTNGLAQTVSQIVKRANTKQGIGSAKYQRIHFQGG